VKEGVAAAKRAVLERCELREDADAKFRSIREPNAAQTFYRERTQRLK
jgi:hypothetical protein